MVLSIFLRQRGSFGFTKTTAERLFSRLREARVRTIVHAACARSTPATPTTPTAPSRAADGTAAAPSSSMTNQSATSQPVTETQIDASAKDVLAVMFGGEHPAYRLAQRDGKVVGIQIGDVPHGSAAARIGGRSNDLIEAVNGVELTSWNAASAVEASTRDGRTFKVRVRRDGRPVMLVLNVSQS